MFRRPGTGHSKASADTLCQKCLKRGHYSYECKASTQERPYKSRPSRTQQLLNPKLQPKLTNELPYELVRKQGVANEILKKKEEERRHSRSLSSSSAESVSTISTNRLPSRSRSPPPRKNDTSESRGGDNKARGKRRRRSVSMASGSSDGDGDRDRNTRRRMSFFSPGERGRRRSRSRSSRLRPSIEDGAARFSRDRSASVRARSRGARRHEKRAHRRPSLERSRSRTPDRMDISEEQPRYGAPRGEWDASSTRRGPAPRDSRDRSPSPYSKRAATRRSLSLKRPRNGDRGPGRNRFGDEPAVPNHRAGPPLPPVQRERSLSPFSKRLALTRAMQTG